MEINALFSIYVPQSQGVSDVVLQETEVEARRGVFSIVSDAQTMIPRSKLGFEFKQNTTSEKHSRQARLVHTAESRGLRNDGGGAFKTEHTSDRRQNPTYITRRRPVEPPPNRQLTRNTLCLPCPSIDDT